MEFSQMLHNVLYIFLTLILPVVTKYAIDLIKTKIEESDIIADATNS